MTSDLSDSNILDENTFKVSQSSKIYETSILSNFNDLKENKINDYSSMKFEVNHRDLTDKTSDIIENKIFD